MTAKFVNLTHRTLTLDTGVTLAPNSAEVLTITSDKKVNLLAKMGFLQVLSATGKKIDRSAITGTPAKATREAIRKQMAADLKAAKLKREAVTGKIGVEASSKPAKSTASKASNAKGK